MEWHRRVVPPSSEGGGSSSCWKWAILMTGSVTAASKKVVCLNAMRSLHSRTGVHSTAWEGTSQEGDFTRKRGGFWIKKSSLILH